MSNDLETFLHGVTDTMEAEKLAAEDLSCLTEEELAAVAFGEEPDLLDKLAACGGSTMRPADVAAHYREKGKKKKEAGDVDVPGNVTYDGDVNNGESSDPGWPRAAMGVDSAGRRATDSEEKKQDDKATPQHVTPKTAFFKSPEQRKLLEEGRKGIQANRDANAAKLKEHPDGIRGWWTQKKLKANDKDLAFFDEALGKTSALSDAKQEKGLGKAVKGLAHSKMDPDQKAALAKGLGKAIEKEKAESDPAKFSSVQTVKDILSGGASRIIRKGREKEKKSGLIGAVEKTAKKDKKKSKTPASAIGSAVFGPIGLLGAFGGGATGTHLATRKYRKDD